MNFSVNKKELGDAVTNIQRAVSGKTTNPVLEGILIRTLENSIQLSAYDLELGMQTIVNASIEEKGATVLSAKIFSDIVKKAPSETISFSIDEKNIATITSGNSSFTIVGINSEEFPELPQVGGTENLIVPGETIKSMIRQTIFAIAENDNKPIHQGSLFVAENGMLNIISVDGYRLAIRSEKIDSLVTTSFVVPGKTLTEVLKIAGEGDVEIFPGRRYIMFKIGNYTIVSGILEGEFLDYKSAIPKEHTTEVLVNTRSFIESTERVSLLISDRLKSPIRCNFEGNEIRISCTTSMGRASDEISSSISGGNLEMGFNNRYLLEALRNSECDEVKIKLTGFLNPMVITPKEGESFLFLVLPVRLKSEG